MRFSFAIALVLAAGPPAAAMEKRVTRIDSLLAAQKGGMIEIQAKGAVASGGWSKPRLHVIRADAHTVQAEFVATPPPPGMTVIEALVPVAASAQIRGRAASVHVAAENNEITSQVLH